MKSDFGLKPDVLSEICSVFAGFPKVGKVVLYGSRAKGNWRPESDIDLTLVAAKSESIDLDLLYKIDDALDELMLPYTFDLSVLALIDNENLVDHIRRVGVTLYQKES